MTDISGIGLPFDPAVTYHQRKVNIPTERWNDLWEGMHARGFMVAGAVTEGLLKDFHAAVDAAIAGGESFASFQRRFDEIVTRHGWDYRGGRVWRAKVIYQTNVRQAYHAGRWSQMTTPDMLKNRPFWQYLHGGSIDPRPDHKSWHELVLPAADPWFSTHYPQNGWGCTCSVRTLSRRDLRRLGKSGADPVPKAAMVRHTDKKTGVEIDVPKGIDPGFAYSPGEAYWGRDQQDRAAREFAAGWDAVESPFKPGGWQNLGLKRELPLDQPTAPLGPAAMSPNDLQRLFREALGADDVILRDPLGAAVVVGRGLVQHAEDDFTRRQRREEYWPLLRSLIEDPAEIWLQWARNRETGRVEIRRRYVKAIARKDGRFVALVADSSAATWAGLTVIRGDIKRVQSMRGDGLRIWQRPALES